MNNKIENFKEITDRMFIKVVDDDKRERIFFVTGTIQKGHDSIICGYFLDEIFGEPIIFTDKISLGKFLGDPLCYSEKVGGPGGLTFEIGIKEYRFLSKEEIADCKVHLLRRFFHFSKKSIKNLIDELGQIKEFIRSV